MQRRRHELHAMVDVLDVQWMGKAANVLMWWWRGSTVHWSRVNGRCAAQINSRGGAAVLAPSLLSFQCVLPLSLSPAQRASPFGVQRWMIDIRAQKRRTMPLSHDQEGDGGSFVNLAEELLFKQIASPIYPAVRTRSAGSLRVAV